MARLTDFLSAHLPTSIPLHFTSYVPGKSPFSTNTAVAAIIVSYLSVIFGIEITLKNQRPFQLNALVRAHNITLSVGSLMLLICILEEIAPMIWRYGPFYALCDERSWTPRMELYYMINYHFKYLEFLDTVFLALRKKPLQFLHVYHHSATAFLCYVQMTGRPSGSWVMASINLTVHVIMYYYYFASAGGANIWWKKYLTTMQIVQFLIVLCTVYFAAYCRLASEWLPQFPHMGSCTGSWPSILLCLVLITSYLALFINFYSQTYRTPTRNVTTVGNSEGK